MTGYETDGKVYYKVGDLIKRWKQEGEEIGERDIKTINNKIKKCFEKIGLIGILDFYRTDSQKDKSKMDEAQENDSQKNGRSEFIFQGYSAPDVIRYLFLICEKYDGAFTREEAKKLGDELAEILPVYRKSKDIRKVEELNDKYLNPVRELEKKKEDKRKTEEGDKGESGENDGENEEDEHYIKVEGVKLIVEKVYSQIDKKEIFKKRFFDPTNNVYKGKKGKKGFFMYEFEQVKIWHDKWYAIMEFTARMRQVERFANAYDKCKKKKIGESIQKEFYKEGKTKSEGMKKIEQHIEWMDSRLFCKEILSLKAKEKNREEDKEENKKENKEENKKENKEENKKGNKKGNKEENKEIDNMDTCFNKCKELVDCIVDYNQDYNQDHKHDKKIKMREEDFYYMLEVAFDELQDVYDRINLKKNRMCYKHFFPDRETKDFDDFMTIEQEVNNSSKNLLYKIYGR